LLFSRLVIRIFSAFPRCCVFKCTDWSLGKIWQLSDATHKRAHERVELWNHRPQAVTARNIRLIVETIITSHTGIACYVEDNAQGTPPHHGFSLSISVTALSLSTAYEPEISASVQNPRFLRSQAV